MLEAVMSHCPDVQLAGAEAQVTAHQGCSSLQTPFPPYPPIPKGQLGSRAHMVI